MTRHFPPPIQALRGADSGAQRGGEMASVTVRADGAAVFQLRYVPAATRTPCSLSTGQIDSTLKPRARICQ
jgi:hypothetical protein